jgi:hypothetical protein
MNIHQAKIAATALDQQFLEPICSRIVRSDRGRDMPHLRWMVQQISTPGFSEDKAMRWLGYIQGVLVGVYDVPLNTMKKINTEAGE